MAATFWFSQPLQFFDRLLTHSYRCSSSLDPVLANLLHRPLSLFSFDRILDGLPFASCHSAMDVEDADDLQEQIDSTRKGVIL